MIGKLAMIEEQESCMTCKFFEKDILDTNEGTCHRNSPKPILVFMSDDEFLANLEVEKSGQVLWPRSFAENFCGDWKENMSKGGG